ncbi:MAG: nucleotidyltransferase family protein, partial [Blautia sp.]|nr:nucleotidyltransferase family protein [Blautia sp.]
MKTAAIVGDFPVIQEEERKYIQRVKSLMRSERLIALISGDFLQPGIPASEDKYQRARKLCDAGVDLVFELPVYCGLNAQDTYAFTVMAFLEKLGCVEEVYLSCHLKKETAEQESPQELLKKVSMRMFMETPDYQKKLKTLKNQGCNHFEAQARVVEAYIPGAEMILRDTENAWAAEYMKALKKMYSPIKPVLLQGTLHMDEAAEMTGEKEEYLSDQGIVEGHSRAFPEANGDNVEPERKLWDERLLRMLQERFRSLESKKATEWLNETFGGTTARSETLYDFFRSG